MTPHMRPSLAAWAHDVGREKLGGRPRRLLEEELEPPSSGSPRGLARCPLDRPGLPLRRLTNPRTGSGISRAHISGGRFPPSLPRYFFMLTTRRRAYLARS